MLEADSTSGRTTQNLSTGSVSRFLKKLSTMLMEQRRGRSSEQVQTAKHSTAENTPKLLSEEVLNLHYSRCLVLRSKFTASPIKRD